MKFQYLLSFPALARQAGAVARGHWKLLRAELSENATEARVHTRQIAVGTGLILGSIPLLLAGVTLLLTVILIPLTGWSALSAATVSVLSMAVAAGGTGWWLSTRGTTGLKTQPVAPVRTFQSLVQTATDLTSIESQPKPTPVMNTQSIKDSASEFTDAAQNSVRDARKSLSDTLYSLGRKVEGSPLLAAALAAVETLTDSRLRRSAGNSLANLSAIPRKHPIPVAVAGAGLGWLVWELSRRDDVKDGVASVAKSATESCKEMQNSAGRVWKAGAEAVRDTASDLAEETEGFVHRWADEARSAGTAVAETAARTAKDVSKFASEAKERVVEASANAVNGARDAGRKVADEVKHGAEVASDFARRQPGIALAGVFVLGALAALALRSRD